MRDFIQHTIDTAKSAFYLYFAPIKSAWFWFAVIILAYLFFNTAEAGYLWTD